MMDVPWVDWMDAWWAVLMVELLVDCTVVWMVVMWATLMVVMMVAYWDELKVVHLVVGLVASMVVS